VEKSIKDINCTSSEDAELSLLEARAMRHHGGYRAALTLCSIARNKLKGLMRSRDAKLPQHSRDNLMRNIALVELESCTNELILSDDYQLASQVTYIANKIEELVEQIPDGEIAGRYYLLCGDISFGRGEFGRALEAYNCAKTRLRSPNLRLHCERSRLICLANLSNKSAVYGNGTSREFAQVLNASINLAHKEYGRNITNVPAALEGVTKALIIVGCEDTANEYLVEAEKAYNIAFDKSASDFYDALAIKRTRLLLLDKTTDMHSSTQAIDRLGHEVLAVAESHGVVRVKKEAELILRRRCLLS